MLVENITACISLNTVFCETKSQSLGLLYIGLFSSRAIFAFLHLETLLLRLEFENKMGAKISLYTVLVHSRTFKRIKIWSSISILLY